MTLAVCCCRLTLDKEDIQAWGQHSKGFVLLAAALSAKWSNNDAIDKAVTGAFPEGQKVGLSAGGPAFSQGQAITGGRLINSIVQPASFRCHLVTAIAAL